MDGHPELVKDDDKEARGLATPEQVDVWLGLDVGREEPFAEVLDDAGERLFARSVVNDQAALEALLGRASKHGTPGLVVDQPGSFTAHQFEVGLEVAASFIEYGLDRGQDVGLVMLGRDMVVPPDSGPVQRSRIMHELASVRWRSDAVEPVLRFAGPQISAATVLVTGRAANAVRVRQAHVALVIHVGPQESVPSVETLQDLPRVLSYGGRL